MFTCELLLDIVLDSVKVHMSDKNMLAGKVVIGPRIYIMGVQLKNEVADFRVLGDDLPSGRNVCPLHTYNITKIRKVILVISGGTIYKQTSELGLAHFHCLEKIADENVARLRLLHQAIHQIHKWNETCQR